MTKTILVGDIGSTKSSWYLSGPENRYISLSGYNPLVQSSSRGEEMIEGLCKEINPVTPDDIWYYGAGVIEVQAADLVRNLISASFPSTSIHISTDLEGAARAACGREPGTVAILGTGSHAAVFDGYHILRQANALGYMLGDEGGGSDIGRSMVQAYFYNEMPELIRIEMKKVIAGSRAEFLKELYTSPSPNQFLADFARVAVGLHEHAWIKNLVSERFQLFVKRHLVPLAPMGPVHILGSIGCIFAGLIEKELNHHGIRMGQLIKDPSYRLLKCT